MVSNLPMLYTNMNLDKNKINERNWELLINAIQEKRVVPIIGENLIQVSVNNITYDAKSYVLEQLSNRFGNGEKFINYSQADDYIRYSIQQIRNAGNTTDIYFEINDILKNVTITLPNFVIDFFKLCNFPLILTTSYVKGIGKILGIPENNIKFYNKNNKSDISEYEISNNTPILYHLFGRMNPTKFKVTDDDLLDYIHHWHNNDTRPIKLGNMLKDKFLLVLGCNYPNWLFRFFWHSIKNFTIEPTSKNMQGVVTITQERADTDDDLMHFLSHIQTTVYKNAEDFINEFNNKYRSRNDDIDSKCIIDIYPNKNETNSHDIFMSYANEDYDIAIKIAEKLRDYGATVWFDKDKLEIGELYEKIIEKEIQNCKRFIPIISSNTLQKGRRFFKKEWSLAIEEAGYRLNEPFISPITIDNYIDYYNEQAIPSSFRKDPHIIDLHAEDFDIQLKKLIRSFR